MQAVRNECLPGLGHLYLGLTRQGIELMVLFFTSTWLIPLLGPFPFSFVIPVLFFYGIFDALQKRDRLARGEAIDTNGTFFRDMNLEWFSDKKWLGWTIIGIGGLVLLKKMGAAGYLYRFNDLIVAMLLIGVGVWMLQKQRQGERVSRPNSAPIDFGKISLAFPKESSVNVHAATEMGSIKGPSGKANGPNAEYKYGDGQHQIVAKTDAETIFIDVD